MPKYSCYFFCKNVYSHRKCLLLYAVGVSLFFLRHDGIMLQKTVGIVLHSLKYNDTSNIVDIYTRHAGRASFLVKVPRSRRAAVQSVLFRPLSLVEFEADYRSASGIFPVKEAGSWYPFRTLPYDPYKSAIALFLAEFLYRALREEAENVPLFAYLEHSVRWLDACDKGFSNFHLVFLMRLSRFLGLYPNTEGYGEGYFFDMLNACFVPVQPAHGAYLPPEEAVHINLLMRMNYDTMHLFAMSRTERNRCLTVINDYYRLHLPDFPVLKSLDVLKEVFS